MEITEAQNDDVYVDIVENIEPVRFSWKIQDLFDLVVFWLQEGLITNKPTQFKINMHNR